MDKSDVVGSKVDADTLAPGFMPREMLEPKPLSPLAGGVVKLERRCKELSELCGEILTSLRLPGNAHLFEDFPEGWFDLLENWDVRYSRLRAMEVLDELMSETS